MEQDSAAEVQQKIAARVRQGKRVRELRALRDLSLRAAAEMAGFSGSYLSLIERGKRSLDSRSTVEALADALKVAPSELTGQPFKAVDRAQSAGHEAASALRAVLRDIEIGEPPTAPPRPIAAIRQEVAAVRALTSASDYAGIAQSVPSLIAELHAVANQQTNGDLLRLLGHVQHAAFYLAKDLGHGDLAWAVAGHLYRTAETISHPAWIGLAQFVRSHAMVGSGARQRALRLVERTSDAVAGVGGDADQVEGMLHLSAAMHAAALRRPEESAAHLSEASEIARVIGEGEFADLHFGPRNVGVWRVALAVEFGEGGRVREHAREVDVAGILSAGRRAMFFADLGRGLASERTTRVHGVESLRQAEDLAPQMIRTNYYVRQTVSDLLTRRLPDTAAREVRGMAYRMGIGV